MTDDPTAAITELLSQLIRNACVNDGTPESGQEHRNVAVLEDVLAGPGLTLEKFEPLPGRHSSAPMKRIDTRSAEQAACGSQ